MISEFIKSPFEFAWHSWKSRGRNTTAQNGKSCNVRISNSAPFLRPSLKVIIFTVLSFSLAHFLEPAHVRPRSDCSGIRFSGWWLCTYSTLSSSFPLSLSFLSNRTAAHILWNQGLRSDIHLHKTIFHIPTLAQTPKRPDRSGEVSRENGERSEDSHSIFYTIIFCLW